MPTFWPCKTFSPSLDLSPRFSALPNGGFPQPPRNLCFATVKEVFLLYLSSLRACGLATQYPNLAGNGGGGKGRNPEPKQPPYERPKKKKIIIPPPPIAKPIPEIYSVLRKAALRTANVRVFLWVYARFSAVKLQLRKTLSLE